MEDVAAWRDAALTPQPTIVASGPLDEGEAGVAVDAVMGALDTLSLSAPGALAERKTVTFLNTGSTAVVDAQAAEQAVVLFALPAGRGDPSTGLFVQALGGVRRGPPVPHRARRDRRQLRADPRQATRSA